ncbi:PREDICTED: uncharacterized protein LOC105597522 [Cercocebus atys]|uniref:uncharacterized protein LOC105597522 n=1 Tax=Cercocebus atys TaxID=9531 RepID=UPI0005F4C2BF|nr:PREDICTED: uncharacterized protein LOC105597522 [Cercocebus atys]
MDDSGSPGATPETRQFAPLPASGVPSPGAAAGEGRTPPAETHALTCTIDCTCPGRREQGPRSGSSSGSRLRPWSRGQCKSGRRSCALRPTLPGGTAGRAGSRGSHRPGGRTVPELPVPGVAQSGGSLHPRVARPPIVRPRAAASQPCRGERATHPKLAAPCADALGSAPCRLLAIPPRGFSPDLTAWTAHSERRSRHSPLKAMLQGETYEGNMFLSCIRNKQAVGARLL